MSPTGKETRRGGQKKSNQFFQTTNQILKLVLKQGCIPYSKVSSRRDLDMLSMKDIVRQITPAIQALDCSVLREHCALL